MLNLLRLFNQATSSPTAAAAPAPTQQPAGADTMATGRRRSSQPAPASQEPEEEPAVAERVQRRTSGRVSLQEGLQELASRAVACSVVWGCRGGCRGCVAAVGRAELRVLETFAPLPRQRPPIDWTFCASCLQHQAPGASGGIQVSHCHLPGCWG